MILHMGRVKKFACQPAGFGENGLVVINRKRLMQGTARSFTLEKPAG
jgi:hypothetical protein